MKFNMGDRIVIRVSAEEMQNNVLEAVDGLPAVITEIYQNSYDPETDRFEVELEEPVSINGESYTVIPGLYLDNIEAIDRPGRDSKHKEQGISPKNEMAVIKFDQFELINSLNENTSKLHAVRSIFRKKQVSK